MQLWILKTFIYYGFGLVMWGLSVAVFLLSLTVGWRKEWKDGGWIPFMVAGIVGTIGFGIALAIGTQFFLDAIWVLFGYEVPSDLCEKCDLCPRHD